MFEIFQGPNGIQGNSGESGDNGEEVSTYYLQIDDSSNGLVRGMAFINPLSNTCTKSSCGVMQNIQVLCTYPVTCGYFNAFLFPKTLGNLFNDFDI